MKINNNNESQQEVCGFQTLSLFSIIMHHHSYALRK